MNSMPGSRTSSKRCSPSDNGVAEQSRLPSVFDGQFLFEKYLGKKLTTVYRFRFYRHQQSMQRSLYEGASREANTEANQQCSTNSD